MKVVQISAAHLDEIVENLTNEVEDSAELIDKPIRGGNLVVSVHHVKHLIRVAVEKIENG